MGHLQLRLIYCFQMLYVRMVKKKAPVLNGFIALKTANFNFEAQHTAGFDSAFKDM